MCVCLCVCVCVCACVCVHVCVRASVFSITKKQQQKTGLDERGGENDGGGVFSQIFFTNRGSLCKQYYNIRPLLFLNVHFQCCVISNCTDSKISASMNWRFLTHFTAPVCNLFRAGKCTHKNIAAGPLTNLLSVQCILTEILSCAHTKIELLVL